MRFVVGCLFIAAASVIFPQSSQEFHYHYGEPDLERFTVRPGVTTTVEYGPDGKACALDIEPRQSLMSKDEALEALNQVAPPEVRGKGDLDSGLGISSGQISVMLVHTTGSEINLTYFDDGTTHGVQKVVVNFKRTECSNVVESAAVPLTSVDFHARYGKPDIERFLVRPGIGLKVEYGSDSLACQIVIRASQSLPRTTEPDRLISVDTVEEILNEVVPPGVRGAKIRDEGGFQSSNTYQVGASYEHVTTMHVRHDCGLLQPNCESSATVTFERVVCENPSK
jgi:hypothetical protein